MAIDGQKDENGKYILKLGNECDLPLILRIKDVCSCKTHLVTNDSCTKLNCSKNKSGDKAQQESQEGFGYHQEHERNWRKTDLWNSIGHYGKEGQGDGKSHGSFNSSGSLGG